MVFPTAPTGVRLEVRGEYYAPDDLVWIEYAPCGCPCGFMVVRDSLTPDAAWAEFHESESAAYSKLQADQGFRIELETFERYRAMSFTSKCPHTPQWGVPEKPIPEGWEWRINDGYFARKSAVQHLFPQKEDGTKYYRDPLVSLCGRARDYYEYKPQGLSGHMACRECTKRSQELVGSNREVGGE